MSVLHLINGGQLQTGYKIKEAQWKGEKVVKHPDADIIKPHYRYCRQAKRYIADYRIHISKSVWKELDHSRTPYVSLNICCIELLNTARRE